MRIYWKLVILSFESPSKGLLEIRVLYSGGKNHVGGKLFILHVAFLFYVSGKNREKQKNEIHFFQGFLRLLHHLSLSLAAHFEIS